MKKLALFVLLVFCCFLVVSCGRKTVPATPQVDPIYEENAIHLQLTADQELNLFQNRPHQLSMCLYQLRDPNSFNQLAGDEEGLYKLLECQRFDPSVATSTRLSIQPGQEVTQSLDRAEGALYVAVVAGYYTLQKDHIIRLFKIPIVVEKKGWLRRTEVYKLGHLDIGLLLGPQELQERGREQ